MGKTTNAPIWRSADRRDERKQTRQARERMEAHDERNELRSWWANDNEGDV